MILESKFKERAVILRKQGKTYSEILKIVPVAKSTLSLWLRSVALARPQKQRLTEKKREAQKRGGLARYKTRLSTTHDILTLAKGEVGLLTPRELLLVGSALYWAEGSKQRKSAKSVGIVFGNTDAVMVRFFYRFLIETLPIISADISLTLYLHESQRLRLGIIESYWRKELGLPRLAFDGIYYKTHIPRTKRVNGGEEYFGLVRIRVRKSTDLQRKISGWIYGINNANWRIV